MSICVHLRFISLLCWLLVSFFAFCSAGCGRKRVLGPPKAVPVSDGGMELKLMTFNVRYENPGDPGSRAWRERVVGAVRMIRDESPDVMGVQEAMHGQAADLWASLPDYEFSGAGRDDGLREGEYTGIFFRRDRFELDPADAGTFWLSDTPEKPGSMTWGNGIPRTVTWVRLTDRATHRGFYVFNTHWDHRHQGSREKAGLLLAERIAARKQSGEPVILLGDFNAVESNPGVTALTATGEKLIDTFRFLHPAEKASTTLHLWRDNRSGGFKIDHILVSRNARVLEAAIRSGDQPMISDHYPVTARVLFP